jgi:1-acyl-sn-glycerol-3-phosphate acyltransferase
MATVRTDEMSYQSLPGRHTEASAARTDIAVITRDQELARTISLNLLRDETVTSTKITTPTAPSFSATAFVVYLPDLSDSGMAPELGEADDVFAKCAAARVKRFILVSSALVYDASFRNPGLMVESKPLPKDLKRVGIASRWRTLEGAARGYFNGEQLTILRCVTLLSPQSANCIVKSLRRRVTFSPAGRDPSFQLLSPSDLARAIECVLKSNVTGIFNVAPDGVVPFRRALKQAGTRRIPTPRTFLTLGDVLRGKSTSSPLDFKCYSWTVSNEKIKAIGFKPRLTSARALREFCLLHHIPHDSRHCPEFEQFDEFGMDPSYIAAYGRTLFQFLGDWYWRIEARGIENIPTHGRAVLAGTHRGFMPWDGVMALDLIVKRIGRYPRFLIHPGLVKFPFLANFMTKLGGIIACQENAKRILENDELLGVFPEGIQGAFTKYTRAYQIHDFHRDAFVKMALRHRAPIVPFVTVGSAEIFPILAKVKSRLWTKYSDWPEFPITPTFPLIPLPLPSKWHTRFLPPIHVEKEHPPSAAADAAVVRAISCEVRNRMQTAIDGMLRKRRSIFFGSVFPKEAE